MKKVLAATAVAAALLAGSASSSFATTYSIGTISGNYTYNLGGAPGTVEKGKFSDTYSFTLANMATLTKASITNAIAASMNKISNFTVSLFAGTTATGTPIASAKAKQIDDGFQFGSLSSSHLGKGDYVLKVSGNTGSASYGGSLAISAVPLPSTVALFGVALAGLGVAGALRRKSASAAV